MQQEHKEWVTKKYPNQRPKVPAVGCLEEAGELVHAILKIELVETWGEDTRHKLPTLRVKLTDAIGDCGIYACSLCNANEWNFAELWGQAPCLEASSTALDAAIQLVKDSVDVALYPQDYTYLYHYMMQLKTVAHSLGIDPDAAIKLTWETVKCR